MKYIVLVVLAVTLGGCVTAGNGSQVSNFLATVQQRTKLACGYLPPAQMVIAVSGTQNGNVEAASQAAANICALIK